MTVAPNRAVFLPPSPRQARVRPEESALGATFYTAMWAAARAKPQFAEAMAKGGVLEYYRTAQATLARMKGGEK